MSGSHSDRDNTVDSKAAEAATVPVPPPVEDPHVRLLASEYDRLCCIHLERDRLKDELYSLRKVVGQAIHQLVNGWSTNALEILQGSVEKP